MAKMLKETSSRFMEIRDPAKAIGLWSCHAEYESTLHPLETTRQTIGRFYNDDLVRFETHAEALEMLAKKGWNKSVAQKMREYAAQYLGERFDEAGNGEWVAVPRWFSAWHNFVRWLIYDKTAKPYSDVRLSFGYAITGSSCCDSTHRTGRVILLRRNGRNYVAVMMKGGWYGWDIIEKSAYQANPYERLVLSSTHGCFWQTVDADIITELVNEKQLCLFEMEQSPIFDALTDPKNKTERLAKLTRHFEFYVHDPNGPNERFYMKWSAFFNVNKTKYTNPDRANVRLVEVMRERGRAWVERQIKVEKISEADHAARWVAENNGCIVLGEDVSDDLRLAVIHALSYIMFPDRPIDAPGGILRGYQLPGRMVQYASKRIRFDIVDKISERMQNHSQETAVRKRQLIVETLLDRAARVLAERNGLKNEEALVRIESVDGRATIETAAWRWGFMEGNALALFTPTPQAGSLKLPDLSLALAFEHRLKLDGAQAIVGKLVQTAPIRSLQESLDAIRYCKDVSLRAKRLHTPKPGMEHDKIVYLGESLRIINDEGRYFLLALPKFSKYNYERDLLYVPGENSVAVQAYRLTSPSRVRSRQDTTVEEETLDINKITFLAQTGRALFYSLDVAENRWLFDATYTLANKRPCRLIPTVPQIFLPGSPQKSCHTERANGAYLVTDVPSDTEAVEIRLKFTINPHVQRDGRKLEGRSWKSYCDAHPEDCSRKIISWPQGDDDSAATLKMATRRVVETDGVLLTDNEHLDVALDAMGYIVTQTADPYAPGGIYHGYMIPDRVFKVTDGRVEWRKAQCKPAEDAANPQKAAEDRRREQSGKPLVEVLSATLVKTAEDAFSRQIESDGLSDKKTAKFFTLEAPIVIGEEFRDMVAREFRRVVYTGTMGWRKQIVRPAHEVALGIWLARLQPDPTLPERAQARENAPASPPSPSKASLRTPEQEARLAVLEGLLTDGLVTQDEYDAKRTEILNS